MPAHNPEVAGSPVIEINEPNGYLLTVFAGQAKKITQPGGDGYREGVFSAGVVDEEDCGEAGDDVLSGEEDGEEDRGSG